VVLGIETMMVEERKQEFQIVEENGPAYVYLESMLLCTYDLHCALLTVAADPCDIAEIPVVAKTIAFQQIPWPFLLSVNGHHNSVFFPAVQRIAAFPGEERTLILESVDYNRDFRVLEALFWIPPTDYLGRVLLFCSRFLAKREF